MSLKQEVHDRLWRAFERWHEIRQSGVSKHDLKVRGIRESGDPNQYTRYEGGCASPQRRLSASRLATQLDALFAAAVRSKYWAII